MADAEITLEALKRLTAEGAVARQPPIEISIALVVHSTKLMDSLRDDNVRSKESGTTAQQAGTILLMLLALADKLKIDLSDAVAAARGE